MRWFYAHKRLTVLLVVFILLLASVVASYVRSGELTLGKGPAMISAFLQAPIFQSSDKLSDTFRGIVRSRELLAENEALKEEIAALEKEILDSQLSAADLQELRQLSGVLNYFNASEGVSYVSADVIAMDNSSWFNVFTINVGTEQGVQKDMAVIDGDGLIGRVMAAGKGWSKVVALIDESSSVSFRVLRDPSILGILSGNGSETLEGYLLDQEASLIVDDVLITSGLGLYPEGIIIGRVTDVTWDSDALLKTLTVESDVSFRNIQKVTVVISAGVPKEEPEPEAGAEAGESGGSE